MIADKFVDLHARNAGLIGRLAFKGGTCLRKLIFGSAGRFSEDLDFTLDTGPRRAQQQRRTTAIEATVSIT